MVENSFFDVLTKSLLLSPGKLVDERLDQRVDDVGLQVLAADLGQLLQEDVDEVELKSERGVEGDGVLRFLKFQGNFTSSELVIYLLVSRINK